MKDYPKVEEIARLANLDLSGMDLERLSSEFNRILDYLDQLEEVAEGAAEPRFHAVAEARPSTPQRPDELRESLAAEEAVGESPADKTDHHFRVPPVIE